MIKKGTWVQISNVVLPHSERPNNIPTDTKTHDLLLWTKGTLLMDSTIGNEVLVKTVTGRTVSGILLEVNPAYHHDYGDFIPELHQIDRIVKTALFGGDYVE